jgi:hypothetical protein
MSASSSRFACALVSVSALAAVTAALAGSASAQSGSLDPINLALGKPARQSSTLYGADASRAVDGNADGAFWDGSVTHTDADANSYWEVDLGQVRQLGRVEVVNRADCCADRLSPFMLLVSDSAIADSDMTVADSAVTPGVMRTVITQARATTYIPINRTGRFVRVALVNQNYLSLAEVRVLEANSAARQRTTSQSSVAGAGYAYNAVDGDLTTGAVTNTEPFPWWQVDMWRVDQIREIDIWMGGPTDPRDHAPQSFFVWVSPTPITADPITVALPGVRGFYVTAPSKGMTAVAINAPGRYIRIEKDHTTSLVLGEVQVWPMARGTLGGHAKMSTVAAGSDASFAIDLDPTASRVATTAGFEPGGRASWDVDLGSSRYIESVRVWRNPADVGLDSYHVLASNTDFVDGSGQPVITLEGSQALPGVSSYGTRVGGIPSATTAVMRQARFIRIIRDRSSALQLAEVEVFTTEGYMTDSSMRNALTWQSPLTATDLFGYFPRPNVLVALYGFQPNASSGSGWYTFLGTATSGTTPYLTSLSAAPLYQFVGSSGLPVPAGSWLPGGVGSVFAEAFDNDGFDATPLRRLDPDGTEDFAWPDARAISSFPTPDDDATQPAYLTSPFGTAEINRFDGIPYAVPLTFDFTMKTYFKGPSVSVRYYNAGELGVGRGAACARGTFTVQSPVGDVQRTGTACYVKEYAPVDGNGHAVFGNQQGALDAMAQGAPPVSVSFLVVFDRPGETSGEAWFGSYVPSGAFGLEARLRTSFDNSGANRVVPNNCLACHGGNAIIGNIDAGVTHETGFYLNGYLLPFDVSAFVYGASPYTYAEQESQFRALNELVLATYPSPAIADFITGSYHGDPAAGAPFDPTYVPAAWAVTPAGTKFYSQVVRPYCRACHQTQVTTSASLDFMNPGDVEAMRALIVADVCVAHRMPHAQQTLKRFWASGARAQLLGYLGRHDFAGEACAP